MEIVVATRNSGKTKEICSILKGLPCRLSFLNEYLEINLDISETGKSFLENASIKVKEIYQILKKPILAEDSGLVIPTLGGEPGVYSARYGSRDGKKLPSEQVNQILLQKMYNQRDRKAYYHSTFVFTLDSETMLHFEGQCWGEIAWEPRGNMGFGFDPIFYIPEKKRTMAELTLTEKNMLSHRFHALEKFMDFFREAFTNNIA